MIAVSLLGERADALSIRESDSWPIRRDDDGSYRFLPKLNYTIGASRRINIGDSLLLFSCFKMYFRDREGRSKITRICGSCV